MADPRARGRFVWFDLMTTDIEGARAFYPRVTGWGTTSWETGNADTPEYVMGTAGDATIGGIGLLPEEAVEKGAHPHWLGYLATPDIEESAARARELGGRVHQPPTDIPQVGRYAVLTDPQGVYFAMFQPAGEAPGPKGPPGVGNVSWAELATSDPVAAYEFYAELFDWHRTDAMDMGADGVYQMFGVDEHPMGGIYRKNAAQPGSPAWLFYVRVPDVNAAADAARDAGGQIVTGPIEVPGGDLVAVGIDPQGGAFGVHQTK